jgi:hypothetical protein
MASLFRTVWFCPNITPDKETGAGTWTDAQFERAIRHGIGHDGRELMDYMPYAFFRSMTDEDVASVIVYIRSLPAIRNALPKTKMSFEVKLNLHPEMEPALPANATEQVRHGWYLVRIAQCKRLPHFSRRKGECANTSDVRWRVPFGGGLGRCGQRKYLHSPLRNFSLRRNDVHRDHSYG